MGSNSKENKRGCSNGRDFSRETKKEGEPEEENKRENGGISPEKGVVPDGFCWENSFSTQKKMTLVKALKKKV